MSVLGIINVIILGVLAIASAVLVIFLAPLLSELRKTVRRMQSLADEEITPLVGQVRKLVEEIRPRIDNITQKIESLTEDEIKPLTSNMKEITGKVSEDMAKVDGMVDAVGEMVSRTHEVVSLYQDKAVIPAIEVISIWDGIKRGVSVFFKRA